MQELKHETTLDDLLDFGSLESIGLVITCNNSGVIRNFLEHMYVTSEPDIDDIRDSLISAITNTSALASYYGEGYIYRTLSPAIKEAPLDQVLSASESFFDLVDREQPESVHFFMVELYCRLQKYEDSKEKADILYEAILKYGLKRLGKDEDDIFVDILSVAKASPDAENPLDLMQRSDYEVRMNVPRHQHGSVIFWVGNLTLNHLTGEFERSYGEEVQEDYKRYVESGEKALEEFNQGKFMQAGYISFLGKGMRYEEDNKVLDDVENKYKEYVSFRGNYLVDSASGECTYKLMVVLDWAKIKRLEADPRAKINEIRDYIISLMPKREEKQVS